MASQVPSFFLLKEFRASKLEGQRLGLEPALRNRHQIIHDRQVAIHASANVAHIAALFLFRLMCCKSLEESGFGQKYPVIRGADKIISNVLRKRLKISMVERVPPGIAYLQHVPLLSGEGWSIGPNNAHGKQHHNG